MPAKNCFMVSKKSKNWYLFIQKAKTTVYYYLTIILNRPNRAYKVDLFTKKPEALVASGFIYSKNMYCLVCIHYHFMITLPHVNPLPKAAKTTVSPDLILPFSQASVKAIGIDAAVVFPYFWILLYT